MHIPRIESLKLTNYEPLFDKIEINFPIGSYLILGGNGLGKTTILQSLVYALAGPFDKDVDKDSKKPLYWNHNYFRGRLDNIELAKVEVSFYLQDKKITVHRGFKGPSILALQIDDKELLNNPNKCNKLYEELIIDFGKYRNYSDFRYIVHKLLYLPEVRPNIAWDMNAQTRILMTICSDIYNEEEFRRKRDLLKKNDSEKRHKHVVITNTKENIVRLLEYNLNEESDDDEIENESDLEINSIDNSKINIEEISKQLSSITETKSMLIQRISEVKRYLSNITNEVEILQDRINNAETNLIMEKIHELEGKEAQLGIFKLISLGLCPACGSKSTDLQARAKHLSSQHCCPLCGTRDDTYSTDDLNSIYSELSKKLKEKINTENEVIDLQEQINNISINQEELQVQYDKYRMTQNTFKLLEYKIPAFSRTQLEIALEEAKKQYNELSIRCVELEKQISEDLEIFQQKAASRINMLKVLYNKYATAFLGTDCELVPFTAETDDKLISLTLYAPKFNKKLREYDYECSEAQRFFLDIAFRMAIIHVAGELHGSFGTFICETPENALDMSYTENVADMFSEFSKEGYSNILTCNIQPGSLSKPLLAYIHPLERKNHYLNLLETGNLTDIQKKSIKNLKEVLNDIIGE